MILKAIHKDIDFLITTYGCKKPKWMANSFLLEKEVRDKWWNISPGDVVIDAGAGYGSYTLSALASGAAIVIAFEPNKNDFFELSSNLFVNGFNSRCILFNIMLGRRSSLCRNYYEESHSLVPEGEPGERIIHDLDSIVSDYNFPKIDWLKIDVDGMELDLLEGAKNTLAKFHPTIIIENHVALIPDVNDKVKDIMVPLGYERVATARGQDGSNENWDCWQHLERFPEGKKQ